MKISPKKWDSKSVEQHLQTINNTGKMSRYSPFHNNDAELRAANLNFSYTQEELDEKAKITANIFYFATNYANVMTDDGVVKIKHLRNYQKKALASLIKHLRVVWLASRQIGKTTHKFTSLSIREKGVNKEIPIYKLYYKHKKGIKYRLMDFLHSLQLSLRNKITG